MHAEEKPLLILSTQIGSAIGRGHVNLLVVKGSDFRPLFGADSVERQGILRWERAVKCGTTASILAVRLNAFYTLQGALAAIAPNDTVAAKFNRHVRRHRRHEHVCRLLASRLVPVRFCTGHAPHLVGRSCRGQGQHKRGRGWGEVPDAVHRTLG